MAIMAMDARGTTINGGLRDGMKFCAGGRVLVGGIEYIILVAMKTVRPQVLLREAKERLEAIQADYGAAGYGMSVAGLASCNRKFLVAGVDERIMRFEGSQLEGLRQDILINLDEQDEDIMGQDIMLGPLAGSPEFIYV